MGCAQSVSRSNENRSRSINIIENSDLNSYSGLSEDRKTALLNATYDSTPPFTIDNEKGWAKVVKAYDGDSCHIAYFYKDEMVRLTCRVKGIDTPEIRTSNAREKEYAYKARDRFIELTNGKLVWVHIQSGDKYGRYLTSFYEDETEAICIQQALIDEGLAYAYNGGTKLDFDVWCPEI